MKKIITIAIIFSLVFTVGLKAQTAAGSLSGNVFDGGKKPIEGLTISLLNAKDSAVVKRTATNAAGAYSFDDLLLGQYLVMASSPAFKSTYSGKHLITESLPAIHIPDLQMMAASKELTGVTVTGRRPLYEQKIDKMVVNVDAAVTNAGATALELLEKSPGVTVDKDGNISLKGKQGVTVMMDGRPTYLSNDQLSNLLKSMPASSIDQIEIITNPSAKYDAAGNSGIINIKSKKNKQKGFNGSVTANYGQGIYWRTNNSLNLNYRNGKFNVFVNGGYSIWNSSQKLDIVRKYSDPGSKQLTAIFEQQSPRKDENKNYNTKIGADYYLNKKTTLGVVLNGNFSPEKQMGVNTSYLKNSNGVVDSIISATSNTKDFWKNKSINLNFRHQYDSTGRELTADADFASYGSNSSQYFSNTILAPDFTPKYMELLRGYLPVDIKIYSAKIDYVQPLKKSAKLETGFKTSYVSTENFAQYFNINEGAETIDYGKTNQFQYKENIIAAYINYNRQIKKWSMQTGLRFEQTIMKGNQFGNPTRPDSSFNRSYGSFFPTVFIGYSADKNNELAVTYGRRIDRPAYQDLNPFLFYLDKFTYGRGNPYLRPQFSHNFELTHTFKGFLSTSLNYSHTKDFMSETFSQGRVADGEDQYATIVRQGNFGVRNNAGMSVSAQVPVNKWFTSIAYANYNYSMFSGKFNNEEVKVEGGNFTFNLNNQFKFEKGWSAELSGWYRTRGIEGQILIKSMGAADAGVAKQVMKGKGTLKLNIRDIFFTQKATGTIKFQSTDAWFRNTRDSRVANLSFVYRFGKPINGARERRNTGGAAEEENRVKKGGNN
jgi:iron complex outermembrane recepter protein